MNSKILFLLVFSSYITGAVFMFSINCNAGQKEPGKSESNSKNLSLNNTSPKEEYSDSVKQFLLKLARANLEASVKNLPPVYPKNEIPEIVKEKRGCFVTLTKKGQLRGCIGYIEGIKPLYEAVIDNAKNAALSDPRFSPVTPDELSQIKIEISILTKPEPIYFKDPQDLLNKIVPFKDGIILTKDFYQSTFLPQVWEQLPDKIQFLEHLSLKAGMHKDGWKTSNVKRYYAIHFEEH
jgi:AmmeMemoRadiSam system protein A